MPSVKRKHKAQANSWETAIQFIVDLLLLWLALQAAIFLRQYSPIGEPILTAPQVTMAAYLLLFVLWLGSETILAIFGKKTKHNTADKLRIAYFTVVFSIAEYLVIRAENPSFSRLFLVFFPFTNLLALLISWRSSFFQLKVGDYVSKKIKALSASFFIRNVMVTLLTLLFYFIVLAWLTPDGVTRNFFSIAWKYLIALIAVFLVAFFLFGRKQPYFWKKEREKLSIYDGILLFLPLTPIIQYVINNQQILGIQDGLTLVAIFALFFASVIFGVPILLGSIGSTLTLMTLGLAISFFVADMPAVSEYFSWFETGSITIQALFFFTVFLATRILYTRQKNLLYLMVAILFVSNSATQLYRLGIEQEQSLGSSDENVFEKNKLFELSVGRRPLVFPNIYLLLYDAYVPNETMLAHGIDNSAQEDYLKEMGFTLYPQTYSVGAGSINTMSRVLNASTEYYGLNRRGVSGDGVVQNLLKSFGYQTYGIFLSDYFFRGIASSYDYSFPEKNMPSVLVSKAILIGEFRFDLGFDQQPDEDYLRAKRDVFVLNSEVPLFLYTHSPLPGHSQNSGTCLANETLLFEERLQKANLEMQQDLDLLVNNDPTAIIIVAGDHGPGLTKNCITDISMYDMSKISRLDLQDRFGTFLAIHWPSSNYEVFDEIVVIQDLFPSIFAFLFNDLNSLETKIEPEIIESRSVGGVSVSDGVIIGGKDDGEPLFLSSQ